MKNFILLLFLLILYFGQFFYVDCQQQCYISSADGDDVMGNGTSTNPWATFTPAFAVSCPIINVDFGSYTSGDNRGFSINYCVDILRWDNGPNTLMAVEAIVNLNSMDRFIQINGPGNGSISHIDKVNFINGFKDNGGVISITGCDLHMTDLYIKDSEGAISSGVKGGGAIYAHSSSTINVVLNNTLFENNIASNGDGGAIIIEGDTIEYNNANLTTYNTTFRNNEADRGGAVFVSNRARALFIDSIFEFNSATPNNNTGSSGGAILGVTISLIETDGCKFINNTVTNDGNFGGAVATDTDSTQVHKDSLFCGNTALGSTSKGGAIHGDTFQLVQFSLLDSVFQNNLADIIIMNDVSPDTACSSTPICHQVAPVVVGGSSICTVGSAPVNPNPVDCYVSQNTGSDANTGTLAMPLATISEAIDRLCKRVHLFPETFDDTILVGGNRDFNINYAIEIFHDPITGSGTSIIDLLGLSRFMELDTNPDNSVIYNVTFINGFETDNGGTFNVIGQYYTRTPLELERVIINASHADGSDAVRGGGAIHSEDSELLIIDSVFSCNSAGSTILLRTGGAIRILDNTGYPIHLDSTVQIIMGSTFIFNFADRGGAISITRVGWARILDSQFSYNTALTEGGGLRVTRTGDVMVNGTKFVCNVASEGGGYHLETKTGGPGSISYLDGDMFCNNIAVNTIGTGVGGGYNRGLSGIPLASELFIGNNSTFQCNYAQTTGSSHTGPPVEVPCTEDALCNILAPADVDGDGICDNCDMYNAINNCSVSFAIVLDTSLNILDFDEYIQEIKNHLVLPFAETYTTIAIYSYETEARIHTTYIDLSVTGNAENLCKFLETIEQGSTLDENWASVFELISETSPLNSPDYVIFLPGADRNLPLPTPGTSARDAADLLRLNNNTRIISVGVYSSTLHRIVSGPTIHPCPDGDGEDEFTLHYDYFNSDNITNFGDIIWNKVGESQLCCDEIKDECGVCNGNNTKCLGCDGVPNSCLLLDDCGICNGTNTCDDGDPCTINECSGGMCIVTGPSLAGTLCDADGDPCTKDDMCDGNFTCIPGQNRETIQMAMGGCADGIPCTFDICTAINATDYNCTSIDRTIVSNSTCYEMHPNFVFDPLKHCGCDDGLFCTENLCNMNGDCENPLKTMGMISNLPGNVTGMVGSSCGGGMVNGPPSICQTGIVICDELNDTFICNGTILPETIDDCGINGTGNGIDENCNGVVDDGCGVTCFNLTDCIPFTPQCSYPRCNVNNLCKYDGDIDRQGDPTGPPIFGLSCDDMFNCTVNDTCDNSGGIAVPAMCIGVVDCDDLDDCHVKDLCDFNNGECLFPNATNGTPCDDLDPCTILDQCVNGTCTGISKLLIPVMSGGCDDNNVCTNDFCNPNNGSCIYTNNMMPCDDLDPCTIQDICINSTCIGIPKVNLTIQQGGCDDGNQCTLDGCHVIHGNCTYKYLLDNPCDDMNACTENDICTFVPILSSIQCVGTNLTCTDGNTCTDDTCNPLTGCVFTANDNNTCLADPSDPCKGGNCWNGTCEGDIINCDDMLPCSAGECDGGQCMYQPIFQGGTTPLCDDGNACTVNDTCINGICVGVMRTCNDFNDCTDDSCDMVLGCLHQPNNNNSCSDNNLCTNNECINGQCQSTPVSCVDDGNPCTNDLCDINTGMCIHPNNNIPCDDGNPCTQIDLCVSGTCTGMDPKDCSTLNPCQSGFCNTMNGVCETINLLDGTSCPDADLCTLDQCMSGVCIHTPVDCDDNNICTQDFCVSGNCVYGNIHAPCDDGLFCTINDLCYNSTCTGEPNNCNEDGLFCNGVFQCNENTDSCDLIPTDCDDNDPCTIDSCIEFNTGGGGLPNGTCTHTPIDGVGDACGIDTGACMMGTRQCFNVNGSAVLFCVNEIGPNPEDCGINGTGNGVDENCNGVVDEGCGTNCTISQDCPLVNCSLVNCVNNTCVYTDNDGISCDDGNPCTINDECQGGICSGIPKISLSISNGGCDDLNPCTNDICDPLRGLCLHTNNNVSCDDGYFCTVNDRCFNGMCVGEPRQCPDPQNEQCKEAVCDEIDNECKFSALNNITCDDSNACTVNDTCNWGLCIGINIDCDDGNPCTDDICNPSIGCINVNNDNLNCHDNDLCTSEQCISGQCISTLIICNPANQCYNATCDSLTGICSQQQLPYGTICDDNIPCTENDMCHNGHCSGTVKNCDDNKPCTNDFCEATSGICMNINNDTLSCDDGNECTINDMCINGECISGRMINCNDNNPCTDDRCDQQTGQCLYSNNNIACDDGNPCTLNDLCSNGICQSGLPKICDDQNLCTDDTCNTTNGLCMFVNDNTNSCEDGNPCTVNRCSNGQCLTRPFDCEDNNICTNDICLNGGCVYSFNQGQCDDGDSCTIDDICIDGFCVGTEIDCTHANPCVTGMCWHGKCEYSFNNKPCEDGDACTVGDVCHFGTCKPGHLINCDDGLFCNGIEICNPVDGTCSTGPSGVIDCGNCQFCNETIDACMDRDFIGKQCGLTDIGACQFGIYGCDINTGNRTCNGQILPTMESCGSNNTGNGIDEDCDGHIDEGCGIICSVVSDCDIEECHDVSCVNYTCIYTGNNDICDDLDPCTENDICNNIPGTNVTSCFGTPIICPESDNNICTNDICDSTDGQCKIEFNNVNCDDGDPCTVNDFCELGQCIGTPVTCNDNNECTEDLCLNMDNQAMCWYKDINDIDCDDGDYCTHGDHCENGECVSTPIICPDTNNECTINICDQTDGQCKTQNVIGQCTDNNACTTSDVCVNGTCTGIDLTCNDNNICTFDSCDFQIGCLFTPDNGGPGSCEDGNPCTVGDFCNNSICISGQFNDCNDFNDCTVDFCNINNGNCIHLNSNQTICDDGDLCTENDMCISGICVGNQKNCNDNNNCTTDFCDPNTGNCLHSYDNGISCNDGNPCTNNDICLNGQCRGIQIDCNDNNICTLDYCDQNNGQCQNIMAKLPCNDGNPCTVNDTCHYDVNGLSVCDGTPKNCDDENQCTNDTCDINNGQCLHTLLSSIPCDDGNPCTLNDICNNGQCIGRLRDCNDNNECTDDICDTNTGRCRNINDNTNTCSDNNLCTINDQCNSGSCFGTLINCRDGNICTNDTCNPRTGMCENINNMIPCDDGNLCTIDDKCTGGICRGLLKNCNDFENCTRDFCDPTTGECINRGLPDWTHCNDENNCTLHDLCVNSVCTGIEVNCNDGNICTDDVCNQLTGICDAINHMRLCDDGDVCTTNDRCVNGTCIGRLSIDCNDNNVCTTDTCSEDPNTGMAMCFYKDITGECDDGDLCTQNDSCSEGICTGSVINCNDNNPCTTDTCNPRTGLCDNMNSILPIYCDDGDLCTDHDICLAGMCVGIPKDCDDGNQCTDNSCNSLTGECQFNPLINNPCDDKDPCTHHDKCVDTCLKKRWINDPDACAQCKGILIDCNDGNQCTNNTCDHLTGECQVINNNLSCDDGNPCTIQDTCVNGRCLGAFKDCNDQNQCTDDSCDITTGECVNNNNDFNICSDGNACTLGDRCSNGECTPWEFVICENLINTCITGECDTNTGKCIEIPDYTLCDDSDLCTTDDHCKNGECVGDLLDCNDNNPCTHDLCFSGTNEAICLYADNNNSECDDGDLCTIEDSCFDGICSGVPKICRDGNICTSDVCNNSTGICEHTNNMLPCDDGNLCTSNDHCELGQCVGTPRRCNDNNDCTSDICDTNTGLCVFTPTDGSFCDDGNLCTLNDTCILDTCTGTPIICIDLGPCVNNPCINGICTPSNNNDLCDDGDQCTENDICNNGECIGTLIDCEDGNPCTNNTCIDGMCFKKDLHDILCDDDNHCTFNDTCVSGECIGTEISCDDNNICTDNRCMDGICIFENNTATCDDGNFCTFDDRCVGGNCIGTIITCDDFNDCTRDECVLGQCNHFPISGDTYCDDGDLCTIHDSCVSGECIGTPLDCNNNNPCTSNECDPMTGTCQEINNNLICDDGDLCTSNDICVNGTCTGLLKDCDDGIPCTDDVCLGGNCYHRQMINEPCNDNNPCTVNDTCRSDNVNHKRDSYAKCIGVPKNCDDGNICTENDCNINTGECEAINNMMSCDDGNPCTINDICNNGTCTGNLKDCNDMNICTIDICDTNTGECMYSPISASCDDNDLCTFNDTCINGDCIGTLKDCDDDDICTINDRCNPMTGECENDLFICDDNNPCSQDICIGMDNIPMCFHKPVNDGILGICDDGDLCTINDRCLNGQCVGEIKNCGSGPSAVCSDGQCDPNTGDCTVLHNNDPCDDGNACTESDQCLQGLCLGTPITCNDHNECTDDTCSPTSGCSFVNNNNKCFVDDDVEGWCSQGSCEINCLLINNCDPTQFTFSWNEYYYPNNDNNNQPLIGDQLLRARNENHYLQHVEISKNNYGIPIGNNVTEFVQNGLLSQEDASVLAFLVEDDGEIYFYIEHDNDDSHSGGHVELIIFEGDLRGELIYKNKNEDIYQWLPSIGYGRFKWDWYYNNRRGVVIGPIPETKVMCFTVWFKHVEYIDQVVFATFNHNTYGVDLIPGPLYPEGSVIHICRTSNIDDYELPSPDDLTDDLCCDPNISDDVLGLTIIIRDFHKDHPDFDGSYLGPDFGIIKDILGYDNKPIYASKTHTPSSSSKSSFNQWFRDVQGVNKKIEYTIELIKSNGVYQFESAYFFPIDNSLFGNEDYDHNYHFTGEVHSNFIYNGGEIFKVGSYDDLFLFINNKLVINFGGVGSLDQINLSLDSIAGLIGLETGNTYKFDLFFTQRHIHKSGLYFGTSCNIDNCFCLDECGMCNGKNEICKGCDNIINSGKVYDSCHVCDGDDSTCHCNHGVYDENKCLCMPGWGGDNCNLCGNPPYSNKKYLCKYNIEDDDNKHDNDDDDFKHNNDDDDKHNNDDEHNNNDDDDFMKGGKGNNNKSTEKPRHPFRFQQEAALEAEKQNQIKKRSHYSFSSHKKPSNSYSNYDLVIVDYKKVKEYINTEKYILPDTYGKDGKHYDCKCLPYGFNYSKSHEHLFDEGKVLNEYNPHDHLSGVHDNIFGTLWIIFIIIIILIVLCLACGGGYCYYGKHCNNVTPCAKTCNTSCDHSCVHSCDNPYHKANYVPVSGHNESNQHIVIGLHPVHNLNNRKQPANHKLDVINIHNITQSNDQLKINPSKIQ
jgi:fibro-slime domain-containing protein